MNKSVNVTGKKRGRPSTGKDPDPFLTARVPQDTIDAIERWADGGKITRSEAIRRLLNLGLERVPAQAQALPYRWDRSSDGQGSEQ
jgi:hypothetical protein